MTYKANEKFVIQVASVTYGTEFFDYPTDQARLAGLARLLKKAADLKDGIERRYYFGHTDENGDFRGREIAAIFDGKAIPFCEYGLPQFAPATT